MTTIVGKVISHQMPNTAVVETVRLIPHPKYGKRIRRLTRYHAHTTQAVQAGQTVRIKPCRPRSITKHWEIVEVVS